MRWRKPQPEPVEVVEPEPEAEAPQLAGTVFVGGACFREGFYYPLINDEHGQELGPDLQHPLVIRDTDGALVHAYPDSPNHFHKYGMNTLEIVPGAEEQQIQ